MYSGVQMYNLNPPGLVRPHIPRQASGKNSSVCYGWPILYLGRFHLTKEYRYGRITRSTGHYPEHDPATTTGATTISLSASCPTVLSASTTGSLLCPAATARKLSVSKSATSGKSLRATSRTARILLWTTAPSVNVPDRGLTRVGVGSIM